MHGNNGKVVKVENTTARKTVRDGTHRAQFQLVLWLVCKFGRQDFPTKVHFGTRKGDRRDVMEMPTQHLQTVAHLHIKDADGVVFGCSGNGDAVGGKIKCRDLIGVSRQHVDALAGAAIPHAGCEIL